MLIDNIHFFISSSVSSSKDAIPLDENKKTMIAEEISKIEFLMLNFPDKYYTETDQTEETTYVWIIPKEVLKQNSKLEFYMMLVFDTQNVYLFINSNYAEIVLFDELISRLQSFIIIPFIFNIKLSLSKLINFQEVTSRLPNLFKNRLNSYVVFILGNLKGNNVQEINEEDINKILAVVNN